MPITAPAEAPAAGGPTATPAPAAKGLRQTLVAGSMPGGYESSPAFPAQTPPGSAAGTPASQPPGPRNTPPQGSRPPAAPSVAPRATPHEPLRAPRGVQVPSVRGPSEPPGGSTGRATLAGVPPPAAGSVTPPPRPSQPPPAAVPARASQPPPGPIPVRPSERPPAAGGSQPPPARPSIPPGLGPPPALAAAHKPLAPPLPRGEPEDDDLGSWSPANLAAAGVGAVDAVRSVRGGVAPSPKAPAVAPRATTTSPAAPASKAAAGKAPVVEPAPATQRRAGKVEPAREAKTKRAAATEAESPATRRGVTDPRREATTHPAMPAAAPAQGDTRPTAPMPRGAAPPPAEDDEAAAWSLAQPGALAQVEAAHPPAAPAVVAVSDAPEPDDLDAGFAQLEAGSLPPAAGHAGDLGAVQELFKQVAAPHVRPIRDFMIEVSLGEPTKEWVDVCTPALSALRQATQQLDLAELGAAVDGFAAALQAADQAPGTTVTGETRAALLTAYQPLVAQMPEAFDHQGEGERREPLIVRSLLQQVPGVRKVQIDRLFRAGLLRLEHYYSTNPAELAATSGLALPLAEAILTRFDQHRAELAGTAPSAERTAELLHLEELVNILAQQHDVFERGAVDRRRARQDRADTLVKVGLMLARLGALELLHVVERVSFERKLQALREYIQERQSARSR